MEKEVKQEGEFSLKGKKTKPKQLGKQNDGPVKVDLTKKEIPTDQGDVIPEVTKVEIKSEENAVSEQKTGELVDDKQTGDIPKVEEQVQEPSSNVELPIEQVSEEELETEVKKVEQEVKEAKRDEQVTGKPLPENIEKLVSFMEETGGDIEDYVRLNYDYSNVDNNTLLKEYYKRTRPHLADDEVSFLLNDNFSYDEEVDEENVVKKKKIAYKEEVAKAKNFLEDAKSRYYEEIKLRPGVTQEQQKAMDFFNRYNERQDVAKQQHNDFISKTKEIFNDEFKGFNFKVGDKTFRYKIKNPNAVADRQSDVSNTIGKFLDSDGNVVDVSGYHKAIYAAENADTLAQHFYEQGKADAIKDVMAKSKNIDESPRKTSSGEVFVNGIKVKALSGVDSNRLKIKKIKL
tara:strand:+ start:1049 stop:2254 length:1206 start_codon:yes stop_codon:yes gene_type:complete